MLRKVGMAAGVAALALGSVAAFAGPAGAAAKVPLGNAHGTLHCTSLTAKVKFTPPLSNANTQPSVTDIKGKVGSCTGTLTGAPGAAVSKAKTTGQIVGNSPGTCSGLTSDGTAPVKIHTVWKATGATMNATDTTWNGVGAEGVGFKLPKTGGTSSSTGSYSGESAVIHAQAALPNLADCNPGPNGKPAKGIKKLTITGGTLDIS